MSIINDLMEIPYIKKDNFALLFPNIKPASFDQNLKNWIKSGKIVKLKRGFYIPSEYWKNCGNKDDYLYYLSSLLYFPSYISKETVLFKYGIMSEAVYGISSVTNKNTRNFTSKIGNFSYSKIKDALFIGYNAMEFNGGKYNIATKSKALFDYLYFIKRSMPHVNKKTAAELRLNIELLSQNDWREFEQYLQIAGSEKMRRIYKLLRKQDAA